MKLSYQKYGWLCVLGGEVFYILCLLYGAALTNEALQLHNAELALWLPGFTWINFGSFLLGAIEVFIGSWIFSLYIVWMFNYSVVRNHTIS